MPQSQVANPRRLFLLVPNTSAHALVPPFLLRLTGSSVQPNLSEPNDTSSLAGYTTHPPLHISTKYYQADVPIWVDELPFPAEAQSPVKAEDISAKEDQTETEGQKQDQSEQQPSSLADWKASFLSPDAKEVRAVIGAIICCIPRPSSSPDTEQQRIPLVIYDALSAIADLKTCIEEERGEIGDVPALLALCGHVQQPRHPTATAIDEDDDLSQAQRPVSGELSLESWDEELSERGLYQFEVLEWDPQAKREEEEKLKGIRNEYGELQGLERLMEVLQTTEWNDGDAANAATDEDVDTSDFLDSENETRFEKRFGDLSLDMMDMHFAVMDGDNEHDGHYDRSHGELLSRAERRDNEMEGSEGNDDDADAEFGVEQLNALVSRMRSLKEIGSEMPLSERKKFAAKAVDDVMKNL